MPPTSTAAIGHDDQARHQYDLADYWNALDAGTPPAVSFLKAPSYQQGGCACSSPLDEQRFLAQTLNRLQASPSWASTAVVVMWDDSDGGYDHVAPPVVNGSVTAADTYTAPGRCGAVGAPKLAGYDGRCGYGPRMPLLVISPWARRNRVDHTLTDQTSVIRFVEDNWLGAKRLGGGSFDQLAGDLRPMFDFTAPTRAPRVLVDPTTGKVTKIY